MFLDNLNNTAFKSNLLASAITERPARVRVLGRSQMVPLNATAFVILTGNGLTISEDLARRFIAVNFDPRTEDPEARPFATDIRAEVTVRRKELLATLLTIWRWGRITSDIEAGLPLGSFAQWCRWARDPLAALGCHDAAARVSEAKARDARRQAVAELFAIMWERHGDHPVAVSHLHDDVKRALDPQGFENLAGTRMSGFILTRQEPVGRWGAATYALKVTDECRDCGDCRGQNTDDPYDPYAGGVQRIRKRSVSVANAPDDPHAGAGLKTRDKRHKLAILDLLRSGRSEWTPEKWRAYFDERCGIAVSYGRRPRAQAESLALACCVTEWLNQHPAPSVPGCCAWCGEAEGPGAVVLPFGTEPRTHTWLHAECWSPWYQTRTAEATKELHLLGIRG